ncbi:MAG: hypothetical protein IID32_00095 [Planctomycetes bacterium]|nr:hypothetical protein [Planctomycetota bacterium]
MKNEYELYKKKKHPHLGIILRDKEYRKVVIDLSVANDLESCFSRSRYTKTVGGNITVQYFIYKIAIQVALLATNSADKYINPDILKADRGKYYDPKTTNEEKMILTQKAKDKGKNGWELGKGRSLQFANKQSVINLDARDPSKYLRQYQSLRGGHWHKVCHGKKRQQRKIVWFPPTLVRPDLPLPKIKR